MEFLLLFLLASPHFCGIKNINLQVFKRFSFYNFFTYFDLTHWVIIILFLLTINKTCSTSINDTTLDNTIKWGDTFILEDHEESDSCIITKYRTSLKQNFREGNGNPLQYSCLGNPMDRGAWWAAVHRVAQSWIQLKWVSSSSSITKFAFEEMY